MLKVLRNTGILLLVFFSGFILAARQDTLANTLLPKILQNPSESTVANTGEPDFSTLWQAWNLLESKFVSGAESVSLQEKIYGLIDGLADSYNDPYTEFFTTEELERFNETVEGGSFSGVGMEIGLTQDGLLRVVTPLVGTPAQAAGIQPGDVILRIDDVNTVDISLEEALSLIRGKEGTSVELTLGRDEDREPIIVSVVRANIDIPILRTREEDNVFIISIYSFSADLNARFKEALEEYEKSSTEGLVIDLRNNPGGYLLSAIEVGSWFVDAGQVLVREQSERDDNQTEKLYRSKGYFNDHINSDPIVVLVNQGSASASEIVAGLLQDYNRAEVYGETTFGKGSVQELIPLSDGTAIKITTARWFTPNGRSISEGGLEPDVTIEDDPETVEIDEQLEAALKAIVTD